MGGACHSRKDSQGSVIQDAIRDMKTKGLPTPEADSIGEKHNGLYLPLSFCVETSP